MRIVDKGWITQSSLTCGEGCRTIPRPCVLASGRWLVAHRTGHDKESLTQRVMVTHSDDGGHTWSRAVEPCGEAPIVRGQSGAFRAGGLTSLGDRRVLLVMSWVDVSDARRPFFDGQTESLLMCETFWSVSEDEGMTWSKPRMITPDRYIEHSRPITGPILVLHDGTWVCQYELNKTYGMSGAWVHLPVMCFSRDQGASWQGSTCPARDPDNRLFYWDQRPTVMADETILNAFWVFDRSTLTYRNIHLSRSSDHGRTWSEPWDIGVAGQPANVQPVGDGRVLLVFVDRAAEPIIKARISTDGGITFPPQEESVVHRRGDLSHAIGSAMDIGDAWREMAEFSVGQPATARLAAGRILVTWYTGTDATRTDIAWALLSTT